MISIYNIVSIELRVCLLQVKARDSIEETLSIVSNYIRNAIRNYNPRVIALPECFNAPYVENQFPNCAEEIPTGLTSRTLAALASELNVYILAGFIERDSDDHNTLYNSCPIWGPDGTLIACHRKVTAFEQFKKRRAVYLLSNGIIRGNCLFI